MDIPVWLLNLLAKFTIVGPLREQLALSKMQLSASEALVGQYYRDNEQLKIDISERDQKITDLTNRISDLEKQINLLNAKPLKYPDLGIR